MKNDGSFKGGRDHVGNKRIDDIKEKRAGCYVEQKVMTICFHNLLTI